MAAFVDQGYFLSVATSKLKTYAGDIIDHFDLRQYFQVLHGSELDGRNAEKGDLVAHILATERLDPANAVMIGDRSHDIVGASANGAASIGVLWGYGDLPELTAAGATRIAAAPAELPAIVGEVLPMREVSSS